MSNCSNESERRYDYNMICLQNCSLDECERPYPQRSAESITIYLRFAERFLINNKIIT